MQPLSPREIVRRLTRLGFDPPRGRGDHQYMSRGKQKVFVPNPHGSVVSVNLIRRMIRNAGITPEEWDAAE